MKLKEVRINLIVCGFNVNWEHRWCQSSWCFWVLCFRISVNFLFGCGWGGYTEIYKWGASWHIHLKRLVLTFGLGYNHLFWQVNKLEKKLYGNKT